ncbi:hypothetical protein C8R44DRAFT_732003 [Mycena epipterygia]|nr:hypothetical protein C8R44DRAFT_732003 [Mycena epipterygia]
MDPRANWRAQEQGGNNSAEIRLLRTRTSGLNFGIWPRRIKIVIAIAIAMNGAEAGTSHFLFTDEGDEGAYDSRRGWLGKDPWEVALEMNKLKESDMVVRSKLSVIAGGACMNDVSLPVTLSFQAKSNALPSHRRIILFGTPPCHWHPGCCYMSPP